VPKKEFELSLTLYYNELKH